MVRLWDRKSIACKDFVENCEIMKKEDYVSLEVAKLLREKGFDIPCKSTISLTGEMIIYDKEQGLQNMTSIGKTIYEFLCPTLYEAQKWLREKHEIHIGIEWGCDVYSYSICRKDEDGLYIEYSFKGEYKTYEECLNEGIKESLKEYVWY